MSSLERSECLALRVLVLYIIALVRDSLNNYSLVLLENDKTVGSILVLFLLRQILLILYETTKLWVGRIYSHLFGCGV